MTAKIAVIFAMVSSIGAAALGATPANLKSVQDETGRVTLQFDRPLSKGQYQTEYFDNTIQLTFQDTNVYPAKISPIRSLAEVTKVFAYQYSPKVVRCRLTVKGDASNLKDKIQFIRHGKELVIRMKQESQDRLTTAASQAVRKSDTHSDSEKGLEADERGLLERILKRDTPAPAPTQGQPSVTAPATAAATAAAAPTFPSPRKALIRLVLATIVLIGGALVFRLLRKSAGGPGLEKDLARAAIRESRPGLFGSLERFAKGKLAKARMIEVVSTHYLGPKKSIAVVRVAGKMMVLGVSQDSINLITRLEDEGDEAAELEAILSGGASTSPSTPVTGTGATSAGAPRFNTMLAKETAQPTVTTSAPKARVREQIRERLGGMKPL